MSFISPTTTTAILTAMTVAGAWFATWLARRGKKEDNRISERGKAFEEVLKLADTRLAEIVRVSSERDAANVEREKVRSLWEDRWDRQMKRCREITDALVSTITGLQNSNDKEAARVIAEGALRALAEHNERDHSLENQ